MLPLNEVYLSGTFSQKESFADLDLQKPSLKKNPSKIWIYENSSLKKNPLKISHFY